MENEDESERETTFRQIYVKYYEIKRKHESNKFSH